MDKPELRPDRIKCLRCTKLFDSRDVCTNRICPACTRINNRDYIPRIITSKVYSSDGGTSKAIESDD